MTESTGVAVGGDLVIDDVYYANCGNSVIQVNKDLRAKLFFNSQCSVDVKGKTDATFDENASADDLQSLGIAVAEDQKPDKAVRAHFEKYKDE